MMLMQWTTAYGVYHQGAQSDAMQKGERNQLFMFRLQAAPLFLIFTILVRRIVKLTSGRNHSRI